MDSGSESDDSFFSYSAKLDMLQSTRNLDLSSAVRKARPSEYDISPMSAMSESPLYSPQSPQLKGTTKFSLRKQVEGKRERKMSHPTKKVLKTNNGRIRSRNPSVSKQSFLPKSSPKVVLLHGIETDLPYESASKGQQTKPEMCDAEVQTTPVVFAEEEQKCPFCHAITFSPNMANHSSRRFSPIRDTLPNGKQYLSHYSLLISSTNFDGPSNKDEGQLASSIKLEGPHPMSSSSSRKTSSFSSSDAMPDDLEHYVRASFSIPKESEEQPKTSIDDPDGLRQGLSALLNGTTYKMTSPPPVEKPKAIEPIQERSMSALSSPPRSGNLSSISGVQFVDPFIASPPWTPTTSLSPKPPPSTGYRSPHRRTSSLRQSLADAPPVPVIPGAYANAQNRRLSGMPGPYSSRPPSVYSSNPSSPPTRTEPQLYYAANVLAKHSPSRPESAGQGSYKGKEVAHDVEGGNEHSQYDSSDEHVLPSTRIIHPLSPVQVAKPFPRRLSTKPEVEEEEDDTEENRRFQRNPSALVANLDPQLQAYLDARIKVLLFHVWH